MAILLAGFVFKSVVTICLKHYGPPEDTGRGSFREGFVLTKQTQGLVVIVNYKVPSINVLMEVFHHKYKGKCLLFSFTAVQGK